MYGIHICVYTSIYVCIYVNIHTQLRLKWRIHVCARTHTHNIKSRIENTKSLIVVIYCFSYYECYPSLLSFSGFLCNYNQNHRHILLLYYLNYIVFVLNFLKCIEIRSAFLLQWHISGIILDLLGHTSGYASLQAHFRSHYTGRHLGRLHVQPTSISRSILNPLFTKTSQRIKVTWGTDCKHKHSTHVRDG